MMLCMIFLAIHLKADLEIQEKGAVLVGEETVRTKNWKLCGLKFGLVINIARVC